MDTAKVIITSNSKVEIVNKLCSYWNFKTVMMKKRNDPESFSDPAIQRQAMEFLRDNTKINEYSFWSSLSEEAQLKAMTCFSLQEVNSGPSKVILTSGREKAVLYVCLTGKATSKSIKTDLTTEYGHGEVLGLVDDFNEVVDNPILFTVNEGGIGGVDQILDFVHGTFVRLELVDLYTRVLKHLIAVRSEYDEELAIIEEMRIDEEIAEKPWQDLTEDDRFYVRVYKRTKERVNAAFFSFADSYRVIPKNASMPAYIYYHEAGIGKEVFLDENDTAWVFVIIDGSVRIDITTTQSDHSDHTLSLTYSDIKDHKRSSPVEGMSIKRNTLPLMSMESGAVICLQPEVFKIGRIPSSSPSGGKFFNSANNSEKRTYTALPPIISKPNSAVLKSSKKLTTRGMLNSSYSNSRNQQQQQQQSAAALPQETSTSAWTSTGKKASGEIFCPSLSPPDNPEAQYNLKMVFLKDTTYLAIPYRYFSKILHKKEGKVRSVLPKIAKEIRSFLAYSNNAVKERITRLTPWITENNIDFEPKVIPPKPTKLDFYPNEIIAKNCIDLDVANLTLGSFDTIKLVDDKAEIKERSKSFFDKSLNTTTTSLSLTQKTKYETAKDKIIDKLKKELRKNKSNPIFVPPQISSANDTSQERGLSGTSTDLFVTMMKKPSESTLNDSDSSSDEDSMSNYS